MHSFHVDPAGSRCLEALTVTVSQASGMRQWYTTTMGLQLASLELCQTCRGSDTVYLRVDGNTLTSLLASVNVLHTKPERRDSSRVPRLRAYRLTWELSSLDLLSIGVDTFAEVEELCFSTSFNGSLEVRRGQVD